MYFSVFYFSVRISPTSNLDRHPAVCHTFHAPVFIWFLRSWKVMESHGILASHGKSWKMESHGKVMEF